MTTMDSGLAFERFNLFHSWVIVQSEKKEQIIVIKKPQMVWKKTATLANDRKTNRQTNAMNDGKDENAFWETKKNDIKCQNRSEFENGKSWI